MMTWYPPYSIDISFVLALRWIDKSKHPAESEVREKLQANLNYLTALIEKELNRKVNRLLEETKNGELALLKLLS